MVIMIIGLIVSLSSLVIIVFQITQKESNKREIMSIFALLSPDDVKCVYDVCDHFIERLDRGDEGIVYLDYVEDTPNGQIMYSGLAASGDE